MNEVNGADMNKKQNNITSRVRSSFLSAIEKYGMDTLMVLTGFSTREDLEKVEEQPTHLVEDLSEWTI